MTPEQIKETRLYKETLPKVVEIWPDKAEEYAKQLSIASKSVANFNPNAINIFSAFIWRFTKQGRNAWYKLHKLIG